jgi:hypothetical protein
MSNALNADIAPRFPAAYSRPMPNALNANGVMLGLIRPVEPSIHSGCTIRVRGGRDCIVFDD